MNYKEKKLSRQLSRIHLMELLETVECMLPKKEGQVISLACYNKYESTKDLIKNCKVEELPKSVATFKFIAVKPEYSDKLEWRLQL